MIRIAVVDDHPIFLEGIVRTLSFAADMTVVAIGGSAADAIAIGHKTSPDILVLDMNIAGGGAMAIEALASEAPSVRVLVLTVVDDEDSVCRAIQKGARGYLLKGIGGAEFMQVLRVIHSGERYVAPTLASALLARLRKPSDGYLRALTVRENQILSLISLGRSNREIGSKLGLTEKTVKRNVSRLLQKLGVRSRLEAALIAAPAGPSRKDPPPQFDTSGAGDVFDIPRG